MNFCYFCGNGLVYKTLIDGSQEKYCFDCDHVFFDSPTPAVIVAVIENDKILLTRSVGWGHLFWGLIAGHVKSGETAEVAAEREVHEEVCLDVFKLKLLGTYVHKKDNLLMIGFKAETKGGDIIKSQELEKARWFNIYRPLPLRSNSISDQIVEQILKKFY